MYFRDLLPRLVKEGDDGNYGSAAVCDTICLQVWILAKLSIFKNINLVWMTWVGIYFSLVQYKLTIVHSLFWAFEWTIVVCEGFFFFFWHPIYTSCVLGLQPPLLDRCFLYILVCLSKGSSMKAYHVWLDQKWSCHVTFMTTPHFILVYHRSEVKYL